MGLNFTNSQTFGSKTRLLSTCGVSTRVSSASVGTDTPLFESIQLPAQAAQQLPSHLHYTLVVSMIAITALLCLKKPCYVYTWARNLLSAGEILLLSFFHPSYRNWVLPLHARCKLVTVSYWGCESGPELDCLPCTSSLCSAFTLVCCCWDLLNICIMLSVSLSTDLWAGVPS